MRDFYAHSFGTWEVCSKPRSKGHKLNTHQHCTKIWRLISSLLSGIYWGHKYATLTELSMSHSVYRASLEDGISPQEDRNHHRKLEFIIPT